MKEGKRVYILGAGCSESYGYPLARDFVEALKDYGQQLAKRENCERLHRIAADTVGLMERSRTPTIDRLVRWISEQPGKIGPQCTAYDHPDNEPWKEKTTWADQQILDAKRVTMCLFLEKEEAVLGTALCGYRDFLDEIFEGSHDLSSLAETSSRVFSFNYDRLFEMAFADHFRLGDYVNRYGKELLNSGWDETGGSTREVAAERFCFLKLHGSAAAWVRGIYGKPRFEVCPAPHATNRVVNDHLFWPPERQPSRIPERNREPFIVFPHEIEDVQESGHTPICKDYLDAVWRTARDLVNDAAEIRVIGYSFDRNDRKTVMDLLRRSADCEIFVQNPDAQTICEELERSDPDLPPLKPIVKLF